MTRSVILGSFLAIVLASHAQNLDTFEETTLPQKITTSELLGNFGAVYAVQWAIYAIDQGKTIGEHGSFQNWYQYPLQPEFDKDNFEFNLIKHTLAGNYYYLFYRYRGYSIQNAFLWSVISTLAFEFTVETVTEKPSIQDIYQTPVLGSVVGIGAENLSRILHSTDTTVGHVFGYLFNPFTLFANETQIVAVPHYDLKSIGATIAWNF